MVREGVFDDPRPEAVFGLHALANLTVGQVGFIEGPALAAVDHFKAQWELESSVMSTPVQPLTLLVVAIAGWLQRGCLR